MNNKTKVKNTYYHDVWDSQWTPSFRINAIFFVKWTKWNISNETWTKKNLDVLSLQYIRYISWQKLINTIQASSNQLANSSYGWFEHNWGDKNIWFHYHLVFVHLKWMSNWNSDPLWFFWCRLQLRSTHIISHNKVTNQNNKKNHICANL